MDLDIKQKSSYLKWVVIFSTIIILIIFYFFFNNTSINKEELWIEKVNLGDIDYSLISSGTLQPKVRRWISSQSSGIVDEILAKSGSIVTKGSIILVLINPQLETELASAKSALKINKAELLSKKLTLKNQQLDLESKLLDIESELKLSRQKLKAEKKLAASGIYSKLDLAQSESKVDQLSSRLKIEKKRFSFFQETIDAQLDAGEANLEELNSKLKLKLNQIENLNIKAGLDGRLQSIDTEIGKNISIGTEVALVTQDFPLIAKIFVNQGSINKIQLRMPVHIDASGVKLTGEISYIAPQVVEGLVEIHVKLPTDYPKSLKSQLNISATISISNIKNTLWLPRPKEISSGHIYMYKLNKNKDVAIRTNITIGKITNTKIEIVSGLSQGDKIILSDTTSWNNIERVNIK